MNVRELIAHLESCDMEKKVVIIITVLDKEDNQDFGVVVRDITKVVENDQLIGIH